MSAEEMHAEEMGAERCKLTRCVLKDQSETAAFRATGDEGRLRIMDVARKERRMIDGRL